jgi:Rad3-related DNA helicase
VVAEALLTSNRTVGLTSTKGLQAQYLDDFEECGLVTVKGKANFTCCKSTARQTVTCEDGSAMGCKGKLGSGCPYQAQYRAACSSPLVVTNYAYWCLINRFGEGLGPVDTLVLDEAHHAPAQVSEQVNTPMSEREVEGMLRAEWPAEWRSLPQWRTWAQTHVTVADMLANKLFKDCHTQPDPDSVKAAKAWRTLAAKLHNIATMKGAWVVEPRLIRGRQDGYRLQAVWPYSYTEDLLFRGIQKVVLISATVNRDTLKLLGIGRSECDFYEYGSTFEPARSPVYFLPTVALNHKAGELEYSLITARIDQIIGDRLDRKGIIHTTSYQRAVDLIERSEYGYLMMLNDSNNTIETVEAFKNSPAPAILVSPSVTTGYDFPMDQCEYQVVMKAPFPDLRGAVQRKRMEEDWSYPSYEMAQTLVQATGRGTRTPHDRCENFLIDDTIRKTFNRSEGLFPKWWREQVVIVDDVPPPPVTIADDDTVSLQELADADQCDTLLDESEEIDWLFTE